MPAPQDDSRDIWSGSGHVQLENVALHPRYTDPEMLIARYEDIFGRLIETGIGLLRPAEKPVGLGSAYYKQVDEGHCRVARPAETGNGGFANARHVLNGRLRRGFHGIVLGSREAGGALGLVEVISVIRHSFRNASAVKLIQDMFFF